MPGAPVYKEPVVGLNRLSLLSRTESVSQFCLAYLLLTDVPSYLRTLLKALDIYYSLLSRTESNTS